MVEPMYKRLKKAEHENNIEYWRKIVADPSYSEELVEIAHKEILRNEKELQNLENVTYLQDWIETLKALVR